MPSNRARPHLLVLLVGALVLGALATAPGVAPAGAVTTIGPDHDVQFTSGGVAFQASLRMPADGTTKVPAAVIIGGTGDVDRDGNGPGLATEAYAWIADLLSAQGWASIRYDKLGTGATGLGPYTADPPAMLPLSYDQLRIQPARAALSFLAAQPGVDTSRLILVGHSEGGGVAISIAHDLKGAPPIAGLALVEPLYAPILGVLDRQFTVQIDAGVQAGAITPGDADTLTTWLRAGIDQIRSGTPPYPDPGPVPLPGAVDLTAAMQSAIETNIYGADPAQMVISHAYRTRYGKDFDQVDGPAIAPDIAVPTLLTCGTKDFNTPCGDGSPGSGVVALDAAFRPGVVDFAVIPDMVHILRDVGDADPSLPDSLAYPFSSVFAATFTDYLTTFDQPAPTTTTTAPPGRAAQPVAATPSFTG